MKVRWTRGVRRLAMAAVAAAVFAPGFAGAQGKITGKIIFSGTPEAAAKLKMDADPVCAAAHPDGADTKELVVANGGVQNVFVYVKKASRATFPPRRSVDQKGCLYSPRVMGLQTGQPLYHQEHDATLHNVHALPTDNPQWNFAMPKFVKQKETRTSQAGGHGPREVRRPSVDDRLRRRAAAPLLRRERQGRHLHDQGLPPGKYTLEAWQEKLGTQTAKVKVEGTGTATSDFTFKKS